MSLGSTIAAAAGLLLRLPFSSSPQAASRRMTSRPPRL